MAIDTTTTHADDIGAMNGTAACPSCGARLMSGAHAQGLCLSCLLNPDATALADGDGDDESAGTLEAGVRLGPYEIVSPLGKGGMGEVYRAWDTRLCRHVAIKVLAASAASDPTLTRRLEHEARIVASLNHPNICAVHDIGRDHDLLYVVMEHLDGDTLADRLARGPLAVAEAVKYASEIADALHTVHGQGITHRDLKPANILITAAGATLLDFGLAALREEADARTGRSRSTDPHAGALPGTVQYMAPEQLEGRAADARSDVFAFGLVLHEMLTAQPAFAATNQARLIAAVLSAEPAVASALRADVPASLQRIITRCLQKDPEARWQSLRDVQFELMSLNEEPASGPRRRAIVRPRVTGRALTGVAVTTIAMALAAGLTMFADTLRHPPDAHVVRFVASPPSSPGGSGSSGMAFVSPDGLQLAWVLTTNEGKSALAVQRFDSAEPMYLAGTDGARWPFWSPDSRALAFFVQGQLKRIDATGGPIETIARAPSGQGGAWGTDGTIVFSPDRNGPLYQVSATGGRPMTLTALDRSRDEVSHQWPAFLPDGRHFVYFATSSRPEHRGLFVGELGSSNHRWLGPSDGGAQYGAPGYLLFTRAQILLAQPFDPAQARLTGEPVVVQSHVYTAEGSGPTCFSTSNTGVLVYHEARLFRHQLAWFNRSGRQLDLPIEAGSYFSPVLSSDGTRIALERHDTRTWQLAVWQFDLARRVFSRVTSDPAITMGALWSSDGRELVFATNHDTTHAIYKVAAQGGTPQLLLESARNVTPTDWSLDRRLLLFHSRELDTGNDVWALPLTPNAQPVPYLHSKFNERQARFSPDGKFVAYSSDESGTYEVYVQPFPASGARWQISDDGGHEPTWRRDGRELFYLSRDRRLMSVPVETAGRFRAGARSELFRVPVDAPGDSRISYAVAGDAQRFLFNVAAADRVRLPPFETDVVLNWASTVHR